MKRHESMTFTRFQIESYFIGSEQNFTVKCEITVILDEISIVEKNDDALCKNIRHDTHFGADLIAALADLQMDDFSHVCIDLNFTVERF